MDGKIIKGIAGFYYVQAEDGFLYECKAKGIFRKDHTKPYVGDEVRLDILDAKQKKGNITVILPRRSVLFRPAVANVDQVAVLFACKSPDINFNLLDRFLVMMESVSMPVLICFTKADLSDKNQCDELLGIYGDSYPVFFTDSEHCTHEGELEGFTSMLNGKVTAFAGPSGVGKSTLMNRICPHAQMETGSISEKIQRGRHTTRHSEMFYIGNQTYLFDTPGFSSLDIDAIDKTELEYCFPEIVPHIGKCKFRGCAHLNEPDCDVKAAVDAGIIAKTRYENYCFFYKELDAMRKY